MKARNLSPVIILGLVALLGPMTGAFAISENERVTEDVKSILAFANFPLDPPSSFSGANIRVEETREETQVFFHILTFDGSTQSEYVGGVITTASDVFRVDRQLRSAELSETQIDLCLPENFDFNELECAAVVDTVTIAAQWEGTGDLERRNFNNVLHDDFFEHRHGINWIRQTTTEGSLDGLVAGNEVVLGQGSGQLFYINAKCTGSELPACEE